MKSERESEIARLRELIGVKLVVGWSFWLNRNERPGRAAMAAEYLGEAEDYISALRELMGKEDA